MDAAELQQEIERTREQLGHTVDELAAKADIKARAKEKAAEVLGRAREKALGSRDIARGKAVELYGQVRRRQPALGQFTQRRWPLAVAAAVAIGVVGSVTLRRRRSSR
jgi:uncharacterized protein YjbJ (UPF0337 family)